MENYFVIKMHDKVKHLTSWNASLHIVLIHSAQMDTF